MTQSTIDFLLNNNVTIIQIVFAIIFLLVVIVILKSFKEEKAESNEISQIIPSKRKQKEEFLMDEEEEGALPSAEDTKEDVPLDDLDNLDELMSMDHKESEIQMSAPPGIPNTELTEALTEKEQVISELKSEINNLQEKTKTTGESSELESKVKELSEKLAEYEIIEDDIANLSFYKTENARLKNELEKLKGSSGSTEDRPAAPPTPVKPPPPKAAPPSANLSEESILNEFEQAVKQKEALEKGQPPATSAPISIKSDSDLLKEFESVVEKELTTEPSKPTPPPAVTAPAPTDEINSNKLVEEVEALSKEKPAPVKEESEKDSNQKLIEEFENFVNKS
jgi:hypothetical protein